MTFAWQNGDPLSFQSWNNTTNAHRVLSYILSHTNMFPHSRCQTRHEQSVFVPETKLRRMDQKNGVSGIVCVLILLLNLAYPQWVKVDCSKPLVRDVLCVKPTSQPEHKVAMITTLEVWDKQCLT